MHRLTSHDPVGELHHDDAGGEGADNESSGGDEGANDRNDPTAELIRQRTYYRTYKYQHHLSLTLLIIINMYINMFILI